MNEQDRTPVASEIEDAYAEIGRTVVQTAIQQSGETGRTSDEGVEATVTVRLLFGAGTAERRPEVCCICTINTDGVWVCAGPCCPTGSPPW
jgi:hypothetical protein